MSKLTNETWKVQWLATPYYGFASPEGKKALVLPRYQRSYVWNDERRRMLIDSIKADFPIGALIVRRTNTKEALKDSNGELVMCDVYEVIDGLQRSTSLIYHQLHPLQILTESTVLKHSRLIGIDLAEIAGNLSDITKASITESSLAVSIAYWARNCTKEIPFASTDGKSRQKYYLNAFNGNDFYLNALVSYLSLTFDASNADLLTRLNETGHEVSLHNLLDVLKSQANITGYSLPVIVWEGPANDAAEIFYRVNQGGMKLSKYQVMAAAWAQNFTDIEDGDVAQAARKMLTPAPGSVVIKRTTSELESLDLYEALVGMSSVLVQGFPTLFKSSTKKEDDDDGQNALDSAPLPHVAFNIASLICKTKLSEMKHLHDNLIKCDFLRDDEGNPSVEKLWHSIKLACQLISESLISLRYGFKGTDPIAHQEQAMAALVASYAVKILTSPGDLQNIKKLAALHVPGHYLNDVLGGITSSHGTDAAAFGRVWMNDDINSSGATSLAAYEPNPHYLVSLNKAIFENTLNGFWLDQQHKTVSAQNKGRPTVDPKQRMVLKFLASSRANWETVERAKDFHLDHSVPFSVIKKWSEQLGGMEYTGGCIANLALLPAQMNLTKSILIIDEWLETKNTGSKAVDENIVWSLLPYSKGDLRFDGSFGTPPTPEQFQDRMQKIWTAMQKDLLSLVR